MSDTMLSYYVPKDWVLLAALDESESYEVDIAEIYRLGDKFILATATGCSCWDGAFESEEFETLDALGVSMVRDERQYNPSFRGAAELLAEAKSKVAAP